MRIISGMAKGRRLKAPKGPDTRPMTDRTKEAVFSSLGDRVVGARVADLYAGSGSLGLEALSRGAGAAVFVESRRAAVSVLRRNIEEIGLGGDVVATTVETFLERASGTFDLAFVDPPYKAPLPSVETVISQLTRLLSDDPVVVVHRRSGSGEVNGCAGLTVVDRRRYGDSEITRLAREAT